MSGYNIFERLEELRLTTDADVWERMVKATGTLLVSAIDALTGGAVKEALVEIDPDTFGQAKRLGLTVPQLERLVAALTADINKLQNELNNLSDPSLFMANDVRETLSSLGFTNNKKLVDNLTRAYYGRQSEISKAHQDYLSENERLRGSIAEKSAELAEAQGALAEASADDNMSLAGKLRQVEKP